MRAAYATPLFDPSDPLVCHSIQLRPDLWAVLFYELERLSKTWSWRQDDPTHATPAQVAKEFLDASDNAIFSGCTMIGQVMWLATAVPDWCLLCDGSEYDNEDYPELAAVIDSAYQTSPITFEVPDLISRFVRGAVVPGTEGGEASHTLTVSEMPAHDHGIHAHSAHDHIGGLDVEAPAGVPDVSASPPFPSTTGTSGVDFTGGGEAHNNLPPYHDLIPVIVARYPVAGG